MDGHQALVFQNVILKSRHPMIPTRPSSWGLNHLLVMPGFGLAGKFNVLLSMRYHKTQLDLSVLTNRNLILFMIFFCIAGLVDIVWFCQIWCLHTYTKYCLPQLSAKSRRSWEHGMEQAKIQKIQGGSSKTSSILLGKHTGCSGWWPSQFGYLRGW